MWTRGVWRLTPSSCEPVPNLPPTPGQGLSCFCAALWGLQPGFWSAWLGAARPGLEKPSQGPSLLRQECQLSPGQRKEASGRECLRADAGGWAGRPGVGEVWAAQSSGVTGGTRREGAPHCRPGGPQSVPRSPSACSLLGGCVDCAAAQC